MVVFFLGCPVTNAIQVFSGYGKAGKSDRVETQETAFFLAGHPIARIPDTNRPDRSNLNLIHRGCGWKALVQTLMLFQFRVGEPNLDSCLFAGTQRISVFRGVRTCKLLPFD